MTSFAESEWLIRAGLIALSFVPVARTADSLRRLFHSDRKSIVEMKGFVRIFCSTVALSLLTTDSKAADFGKFLENAKTLQAEKHDPIYGNATFQVDVLVEFVDNKGKVTDTQRSVEKVTYTAGTESSTVLNCKKSNGADCVAAVEKERDSERTKKGKRGATPSIFRYQTALSPQVEGKYTITQGTPGTQSVDFMPTGAATEDNYKGNYTITDAGEFLHGSMEPIKLPSMVKKLFIELGYEDNRIKKAVIHFDAGVFFIRKRGRMTMTFSDFKVVKPSHESDDS